MIAFSKLFASLVSTATPFLESNCDLVPTMFLDLRQVFNLHLSALSNGNILDGFVCHVSSDVLDLSNNIHAINDLSKDHMLAVEMR